MDEIKLSEKIQGKEIHFRLVSNDLLENDKLSLVAVGTGSTEDAMLRDSLLQKRSYTEYSPQGIPGKLLSNMMGKNSAKREGDAVWVLVEEKSGRVSADDVRYVEWLGQVKGERPKVIMVPEAGTGHTDAPAHHLLDADAQRAIHSFWKRQWRRLKALPAPVTRDAALAAIPRTFIPVAFIIFLAYVKRNEVLLSRVGAYIGLTFGFSIGFAMFNQTVLNWITFWSEFTQDACEPYVKKLEALAAAKQLTALAGFISARGDVLIGAPLMGIGCTYLARLALGPVGETVSVLTLHGFLLVLLNVVVGSIAGGPYTQAIAHLRAVGKITNKASMYLGIVETVKMELGRVADFGMQTLYNIIQVTLAVTFWLLLLVVDRCYLKPNLYRLKDKGDIDFARRMFKGLRERADSKPSAQAVGA